MAPNITREIRKDNNKLKFRLYSLAPSSYDDRENLMEHFDSQIPDSLLSPSLPSEPPDVRNWFSSYVYESPVLDTNDDFGGSVSRESECEKDGFVTRESIRDDGNNLGKSRKDRTSNEEGVEEKVCSGGFLKRIGSSEGCKHETHSSVKFLDSLHSSCLLSEPLDVTKWFSSYEYESPVVSTIDEFGDSVSLKDGVCIEESDTEKEKHLEIIRKSSNRHEVVIGGKLLQEKMSISKDMDKVKEKENTFSSTDLCFEQSSENISLENNSSNSTKDVEKSSFNYEASLGKLRKVFFNEATCLPLYVNGRTGDNERKSPRKLIHRTVIEESLKDKLSTELDCISTESKLMPSMVSAASIRKSTHGSSDKENEQKEMTENGFVTTKKTLFKGTNDKNSSRRSQEYLLECVRNKGLVRSAGENDAAVRRKVLSETINFQHSGTLEVIGKWLCPQKNKSNNGPPLKQLRLEQWVKRM